MSLLQKASIITTPTAYAEDYLYSIKPAKVTFNSVTSFANGTTYALTTFTSSANNVTSGIVSSAFGGCVSNAITLKKNQKVKVTFDYTQNSGNELRVLFSSVVTGAGTVISDLTTINATGTFDYTFTITSDSTGYLQLGTGNSGHSINFSALNVRAEVLSLADFDFDRNSTGTRVNEDYLIEDVPYNLLAYSQDFSQWTNSNSTDSVSTTLSPDGSSFSTNFAENTATAQHKLTRSVSFDGSSTYTFSVFVKSNGRDIYLDVGNNTRFGGRASFNLTTGVATSVMGTPSIENFGNGWFRCIVTGASTSAGSTTLELLTFNGSTNSYEGDGSSGVFVWGAQVVKGDQPKDYLKTTDRLDIPRIDYTNGEPSILLEPNRTNSYQYSNDVTQSFWLNMGILIDTSNLYLSPEGINNAQKITANVGSFRLLRPSSDISGTGYAVSVFVKNINALNFYIRTTSGFSYYNFETKTVNLAGSDNLTVTHYPNDWVRLITTTPHTTYKQFGIGQSETDSNDIGNSVYIYGAQLEAGSYATSLIHTSGSTVTRSADAANNAGNSDLINSTEGVLYAEIASNDTGAARILSLSDNTTNNSIRFEYSSTANQVRIRYRNGGATQNDFIHTLSNEEEFNKIAFKYKVNDFSLYVNGTEVATDTSGSVVAANTFTTLKFLRGDNSNDFYGNVKSVMVFKEALTDLELEKLTGYNNHELYMNYYNRLSYLGLAEEYNVESDINNYIL